MEHIQAECCREMTLRGEPWIIKGLVMVQYKQNLLKVERGIVNLAFFIRWKGLIMLWRMSSVRLPVC